MDLVTLDFETFYSKEFSLSRLTTEEYIRDDRFEVIGVGIKVNDGDATWHTGKKNVRKALSVIDWENSAMLAHNNMFDAAILSFIFNINPKLLLDTLCMARALHGTEISVALKALAERYGVGKKGTEVNDALGKHLHDFSPAELHKYGLYCVKDVELCYQLFKLMVKGFPKAELNLIDITLRMFTQPVFCIDSGKLVKHVRKLGKMKQSLIADAGVEKADLMSNPKFAELLKGYGVVSPIKTSPATGKQTFAFAKKDAGFVALQEHADPKVQTLVAARLGNKSTLEETRAQRFIDIASRGLLPVPIRYYAAHTGRWGGDDKINMQNLPSRGPNGKVIKTAIRAPKGYRVIDCDSSQIEARVLAWLAGQDDLVEAFANKEDVYKKMASSIYNVPVADVNPYPQRFVGKTTILGAGYNMGGPRFREQLAEYGLEIDGAEARRVISVYRAAHPKITQIWRDAHLWVEETAKGYDAPDFGLKDVLRFDEKGAIRLPSGLLIRYDDLKGEPSEYGYEYTYKTRRGRKHLYGGKVIENVVQGIARCVVGEQMIAISKRYRPALTVHDSIAVVVPKKEVKAAKKYVFECMSRTPKWAEGLPVACELGVGKSYGACE